jgi:hypothetical protein
VVYQPRNRENEDLIAELYRVNADLHKKNLVNTATTYRHIIYIHII